MKTLFDTDRKKGKPTATMNRRDFLRYSGAACGALLFGLHGELVMANQKSRVALVNTEDRKSEKKCKASPVDPLVLLRIRRLPFKFLEIILS